VPRRSTPTAEKPTLALVRSPESRLADALLRRIDTDRGPTSTIAWLQCRAVASDLLGAIDDETAERAIAAVEGKDR